MRTIIGTAAGLLPVLVLVLGQPAGAQGPASAGFHLDLIANLTSTHASVADMPLAVGSFVGIPAGMPGNPYSAYAAPGTSVKAVITIPAGTLGPAPFGAQNPVTLFWAIGTPELPIGIPPGVVPPAMAGPLIISVLPPAGAIVDGLGVYSVPLPPTPPADPGYPLKLEISMHFPIPIATAPIKFQAAVLLPGGMIGITNGASLVAGMNPAEVSLLPMLIPDAGGGGPLDDGTAFGIPTPPGFAFYGVPVTSCNVNTNGFVDFLFAGAVVPVDPTGSAGDLGCAPATPTARPRVDVNHHDADFSIPTMASFISDLTVEMAAPMPPTPPRTIVRWKNVPAGTSPAGPLLTDMSTMVVELMGDQRIAVVRTMTQSVTTLANHDQVGIGPGLAGQGFGGPPICILPAATGLPIWTLYGTPGYLGMNLEAIWQDNLWFSQMLTNLAVVFTPGPLGAASYTMTVH